MHGRTGGQRRTNALANWLPGELLDGLGFSLFCPFSFSSFSLSRVDVVVVVVLSVFPLEIISFVMIMMRRHGLSWCNWMCLLLGGISGDDYDPPPPLPLVSARIDQFDVPGQPVSQPSMHT